MMMEGFHDRPSVRWYPGMMRDVLLVIIIILWAWQFILRWNTVTSCFMIIRVIPRDQISLGGS